MKYGRARREKKEQDISNTGRIMEMTGEQRDETEGRYELCVCVCAHSSIEQY